jgi:hypothetical protein
MSRTESILIALVCASALACEPEGAEAEIDTGAEIDASSDDGTVQPVAGSEDTGEPASPDGDVFLRNRVALDMDILIRPLDPETAPGCELIAADPAALPLDAFADGRVETLNPHEITVVWPHAPAERECYAVWIESDGLGARILFWWDGDPPPQVAPTDCCSDGPGILQLIPTDDGWSLHLIGDTRLVHTPAAEG